MASFRPPGLEPRLARLSMSHLDFSVSLRDCSCGLCAVLDRGLYGGLLGEPEALSLAST